MFTVISVTCPHCAKSFEASVTPYEELAEIRCDACGRTIRKNASDHCVICAYGNSVCPNLQCRRDCCSG